MHHKGNNSACRRADGCKKAAGESFGGNKVSSRQPEAGSPPPHSGRTVIRRDFPEDGDVPTLTEGAAGKGQEKFVGKKILMECIMKRIDDIEKMGLEELEAAAMAGNTGVPQGLEERIKERILAREITRLPVGRRVMQLGGIAAAVVLALLIFNPWRMDDQLQDTFEDPRMAYAQVEKAFAEISNKMSMGVEMVSQAKPLAEKPLEILNKTTQIK